MGDDARVDHAARLQPIHPADLAGFVATFRMRRAWTRCHLMRMKDWFYANIKFSKGMPFPVVTTYKAGTGGTRLEPGPWTGGFADPGLAGYEDQLIRQISWRMIGWRRVVNKITRQAKNKHMWIGQWPDGQAPSVGYIAALDPVPNRLGIKDAERRALAREYVERFARFEDLRGHYRAMAETTETVLRSISDGSRLLEGLLRTDGALGTVPDPLRDGGDGHAIAAPLLGRRDA